MSTKVIAGRYELIEKIGDGGMAVVYKAKCRLLNRYVAVKILKPEFTKDAKFIENFRKESHAAASLNHPNIVGVYDVGREGNINYIVMELVEGKTLSDIIYEEAPLDYKRTINIAKQIGAGLSVAHKRGIIHRDIKPHNIMITNEGVAKITDFGIAKAISSTTIADATTENIMGSVHYFSPEQARGGYVDEKSDIYSLGIVIYEMLTGKVPFDGENPVSVALMHINNEITPPSQLVPGIPPRLEQIVLKATSKYQTDRFSSIDEMIAELDNIEFVTRIVGGPAIDSNAQRKPSEAELNQYSEAVNEGPIETSAKKKVKKQPKQGGNKKKTIIIISAVVAGVLLLLGIAGFATGFFSKKDIVVPDLRGKSYAEAEKILKDRDLLIEEGEQIYNDEYAAGQIAAQSPEPNLMVKAETIIIVNISKGSEIGTVPSVLGKTESEARQILEGKGFLLGAVTQSQSDKPKGEIIQQDPSAGSELKAGGVVNIVVSDGTGKAEEDVPYLIGKDWSVAKDAILAAGFKVGNIEYDYNNTYSENQVIWQQYEAGESLAKGTKISVKISKGPQTNEGDPQ